MWLIVVLAILGLIPAFMARKTGRTFWHWWLYGIAAWPVAIIHVAAARSPAEGGTGTAGKAAAAIIGILVGCLTITLVSIAFMSSEDWDAAMKESARERAERKSSEQEESVAVIKEGAKLPGYRIEEERDASHGAASRITFWARLVDEGVSEDGIRLLIKDVVDRNSERYDIIWVEVVPPEGRPRGEGFYGWVPVISSAKWISPDLDEVYHTTTSGPNSGENLDGIVVSWMAKNPVMDALESASSGDQTEKKPAPLFDPSTIIGRLQTPLLCEDAANLQWKRIDLNDGTERWLGSTSNSDFEFEVTPDYLYVLGDISKPPAAEKTALAFFELNSVVFPDDYESVNNRIVSLMMKQAEAGDDSEFSEEFDGWLLEMRPFPTLSKMSYKVSRPD